ncbi:MAG: efflux RND transporter periplasmic adaptor subunit [Verrucomicrobiota bacterium]
MANATSVARERVAHLERRYGRSRVYWVTAGILALLLLLVGIRLIGGRKKAAPAPPPKPVFTAKASTQDVPLYLDEIGTCAAFETVQIQAQVNGQIMSRNFKDGADVKKGDPLFNIDPRPFQAALDQAKGQLAQAQSQQVLNQITLKRQQELRSRSVTSPQDLDTAQANVSVDLAKAKTAEAAVAAAQVNLDYCDIRSPIDGRVGLRNVDVGNVVTPNSATPLVTIQGMDPIYTDFTIAEPDLPLVRRYLGGPNVKVETDAEDDSVPARRGDLYFVDSAVQPGVGTVRARGVTPNPDRALWPSQFVRVRLILDVLKDAILVPSSAVQTGQNGPYVFVVKPDSTLDLRPVKPGQRQGDLTVISEGIKQGETVVTSGQLQLAPGAKVSPKPLPAPTISVEKDKGGGASTPALR